MASPQDWSKTMRRAINPVPYMVVRRLETPRRQRAQWLKMPFFWTSGAILGGIVVGACATLFIGTKADPAESIRSLQRAGLTQTIVPVTYVSSATSTGGPTRDLEEVRTRNRRLEALVKVLRRRDAKVRRAGTIHTN